MTESRPPSDDPLADRAPTYHERLTGRPWDTSYRDGPAPWDPGHPQPAVTRLAGRGVFAGPVLEVGCGTGENALHLAALGLPVMGIDVAETALTQARTKAAERGVQATFLLADALRLDRLEQTYASVVDVGVFHTFDDQERRRYVESLGTVTEPGAVLHLLCFSDVGPDGGGPRRVGRDELRAAFGDGTGWQVQSIEPERYETRDHEPGAPAWLAAIRRG